ncbi:hypothetical protein ACSBR2_041657 [Camellia fascicularis]
MDLAFGPFVSKSDPVGKLTPLGSTHRPTQGPARPTHGLVPGLDPPHPKAEPKPLPSFDSSTLPRPKYPWVWGAISHMTLHGVSDGRVIKYQALTANFLNFAVTSPRRTSELCDGTNDKNLGPRCGRPLGLGFNQITGQLYINDPFVGLTVVGPTGGNATQSIQSGDSTGRLLRYDPKTKQVIVLMRGLAGPVGVAVSKDGTFVLVSKFIHKRIQKYWIRGDKANTSEILINFQGNPNKIKRNKDGEFWVALNNQNQQQPTLVALVGIKIDGLGTVLETVDLSAQYNQRITVVQEQLGSLYVGSRTVDFIGVFT